MIRVIINADDLGKSHLVNSRISAALQNDIITSSTILANTEFWEDVHEIIDANPKASFGVHLNLTEGRALTNQFVFLERGIVDNNNCFTKKIREVNLNDEELKCAVFQEWDAQIKKVVEEQGIAITHVDGHHHIHTEYAFREILASLAKKWHIRYVRSRYLYPQKGLGRMIRTLASKVFPSVWYKITESKSNRLFSVIHSFAETELWRRYMSQQCLMTDYFDSYEHFYHQLTSSYKVPDVKVVELMCHPGHQHYTNEYEMIASKALSYIQDDIEYISYRTLE